MTELVRLTINCRTNIPRYLNGDGWTYAWANWARGSSVEWIEVVW